MKYIVGQQVYAGHEIVAIVEEKDKYVLYIEKDGETLKWKDFNKQMAIGIEYDIDFNEKLI